MLTASSIKNLLRKILKLASCLARAILPLPPPHRHLEAAGHVRGEQRHELRRALRRHGAELEPPEHGAGHELHLHERHVLAEARPRPALEHRVLERRHAAARRRRRKPPPRPELAGIGAPDGLHPAHPVGEVGDAVAAPHARAVREHVVLRRVLRVPRHRRVQPHRLAEHGVEHPRPARALEVHAGEATAVAAVAHARVDLVQDLPLHVAVARHEPEEPRQRRRRRVAAGHDEAHHHVADRLVGVPRRGHPRHQVVAAARRRQQLLPPPAAAAVTDELHDRVAYHLHLLPEPPLRADAQRALHLPRGGPRRRAPPGAARRGGVERRGQPRQRQCQCHLAAAAAERHPADHVERELPEQLLHVDDDHAAATLRRRVERRQEPRARLPLQRDAHRLPHHAGAELVAHQLPLREPPLAVGVEDAAAEQIAEHVRERLPLGVVPEVRPEDVLDVRRVRRDHGAARAEAVDDDGLRRRRREEARVPRQMPPAVAVEVEQAADQRVAPGSVVIVGAAARTAAAGRRRQGIAGYGVEQEEAARQQWQHVAAALQIHGVCCKWGIIGDDDQVRVMYFTCIISYWC